MKVFNRLCKSSPKLIPESYKFLDTQQKLKYEQRVEENEQL